MITKQTVQRTVRERSERIRLAAMRFVKRAHGARLLIPFAELPNPCYMFQTDADLESFLRTNNLTVALEAYLAARKQRTCADCGESIPVDQRLCSCNTSRDLA